MAIVFIVMAVALPAFMRAYNSMRLSGAATDVRDMLLQARTQAITLNKMVDCVVQISSKDPTRTNVWSDVNQNGIADPTEKIILLGPYGNLVDSSVVPGTNSLLAKAANGLAPATPSPTNSKVTFDARGALSPLYASVFYLSSLVAPAAGFRAVILFSSGSSQVLLHELSPRIQQNFVTLLSQKVSRKTVLNVLATLSSMLRTAKSWGYCTQAIATRELALPVDEVHKQTRFFNGEEARRIITVASEPYRTMFAIAAMTGLRVGEVVGLQKADLDFERRLIHVLRSAWYGRVQTVKSRASRAPVAMAEALLKLLTDYLAMWKPNPDGFLFLNRNGRPYAANKVVEYGLWPVLDKLGIERAGMHAFRHCHASLLMDVGANPTVTKTQMRHSDARITLEVYGHVIGDSQREAVDKVGEILRPDAKLCAQMRPN